jgi:hypothetical protein
MSATDDDGAVAGAWDEFCETLREAGRAVLERGTARPAPTSADGFHHLTQLLSLGIDLFLARADADFPEFTTVITPTRKWALDNPVSHYDRAPVAGGSTYRVTGHRGTARLLLFDVNAGLTGTRRTRRQLAHLTSEELEVAPDGTFELVLGGEPRPGNWLPLDDGLSPYDFGLIIRQYFVDGERESPATFSIERVDGPARPSPRRPADVARGLREAANFVRDSVEYWGSVTDELAQAPNQLLPAKASSSIHSGANPDNVYYGGYWNLAADEALVIDVEPAPRAEFWNFYVSDAWWVTPDERHHRANIDSSTAEVGGDGALRLVLADGDLGVANQVETAGHREGMMLLRMTFPELLPAVRTRVVPARQLSRGADGTSGTTGRG